MNDGLRFETFGVGISHMAEGEPETCGACKGAGEVVIKLHDVVIDTVPCPRGCVASPL